MPRVVLCVLLAFWTTIKDASALDLVQSDGSGRSTFTITRNRSSAFLFFQNNDTFTIPCHLPISLSGPIFPQLVQLKWLSCLWNVRGMRGDSMRAEGKENLPPPSPGPLTAVRVINEAAVSLKSPRSGGTVRERREGSCGVPCVGGGSL